MAYQKRLRYLILLPCIVLSVIENRRPHACMPELLRAPQSMVQLRLFYERGRVPAATVMFVARHS